MSTPSTPNALNIRTDALPSWHQLGGVLLALDEAGVVTPCAAMPLAFTSDEPTERRDAVEACQACSALLACARFADENRERFGVWGGRDRGPRPKRPSATASPAAS